jgi:hypothetical protein
MIGFVMKSISNISGGGFACGGGVPAAGGYASAACYSFACCYLNRMGFIVKLNVRMPVLSIGSK